MTRSRLNAVEQGVRERDAGCNLYASTVGNTSSTRTVGSTASLAPRVARGPGTQHREMLARVKEFDGDVDKLLAEYQHQNSPSSSLIRNSIRSSRIVLKSRDEYRNECRDKHRLECGSEFQCVFGSRFEYGFEYVFKCVSMQSENVVTRCWQMS